MVYLAGAIAEVLHDLLGGGLLGNSQHHQGPPDLLHQLGVRAAWERGEGRQPGLKFIFVNSLVSSVTSVLHHDHCHDHRIDNRSFG